MAKLILTDEEKKAATYLEWDNEAIGMCVKALAKKLQDHEGTETLHCQAAAVLLACRTHEAGSTTFELMLEGVTNNDKEYGDYKVTVERVTG